MDAELQATLDRRRLLVEGRNGNHSNLIFVSTRRLSVHSPHRTRRPWARRGTTCATNEKPRQTVNSSSRKSFPAQNAKASPNVLTVELSSPTTRNVLSKEVEKMKTTVNKDRHSGAEDLLRLLTETSQLLAQSKQSLQHRQEISEQAHKPPELGYFPTNAPACFEGTSGTSGDEKSNYEEPSPMYTHKRKDVAVRELQKALTEQAATMTLLQKENAELHQQNDCLSVDLSNMQKKFEQLEDQFKRATSFSYESHLRSALCDNSSSMDDLKEAINASEALLNEAKREYANKKFRAKRAALEELEVALEKGEEETLSAAIVAARQVDVDAVDLERPEEKLKALRVMTQEQHAAKAARKLLQKQKKTAFALVKKDDVMNFKELIDEVGKGVSWCDWRDPLGRTVWRCAKDLRALRMQEFLKQLGVGDEQPDAKVQRPTSKQILQQTEQQQQHHQKQEQQRQQQQDVSLDLPHSGVDSNCSTAFPAEDSIAIAKSKAFRAAAQDDFRTLNEIFDSVSVDIWSKWENRAGKTLLTLSQERKSSAVHSQVAKALGIVKQLKRETFEERETVWVYVRGDVQPKRATVLADTLEDTEMIPVEYWEGNEPATCVDRCSIRKMFS